MGEKINWKLEGISFAVFLMCVTLEVGSNQLHTFQFHIVVVR
jgi:hypothetical protein